MLRALPDASKPHSANISTIIAASIFPKRSVACQLMHSGLVVAAGRENEAARSGVKRRPRGSASCIHIRAICRLDKAAGA